MQSTVHSVEQYFTARSKYWSDVYRSTDIFSVIYQERQERALHFVDQLALPPDASILEAGCGAGMFSIALFQRGHSHIEATDNSPGMLEQACANATAHGILEQIPFRRADVFNLPYPDESFDLVISLGVIPWLDQPRRAIAEFSRIIRPGGSLVISTDNRWRLVFVLDPKASPLLSSVRSGIKSVLRGLRLISPDPTVKNFRHAPRELDAMLAEAHFLIMRHTSLGFGPFTFFGRQFLPSAITNSLNSVIQKLADRNVPFLRSGGSQYLVLARKNVLPAE